MNHLVKNRFLMRRLGFVADPRTKSQIVPHDRATYWRHQPSGALVVTFHDTRYTEAKIVRRAISAAIGMTLTQIEDKVSSVISAARNANEEADYQWGKQQRKQ